MAYAPNINHGSFMVLLGHLASLMVLTLILKGKSEETFEHYIHCTFPHQNPQNCTRFQLISLFSGSSAALRSQRDVQMSAAPQLQRQVAEPALRFHHCAALRTARAEFLESTLQSKLPILRYTCCSFGAHCPVAVAVKKRAVHLYFSLTSLLPECVYTCMDPIFCTKYI